MRQTRRFSPDRSAWPVGDTYKRLKALHEEGRADWLGYSEVRAEENNGLQEVYRMFFDPEGEEECVDGERMPKLYEEGDIEAVVEHCRRDVVVRLKKVAEVVVPSLPEHELDRGIRKL